MYGLTEKEFKQACEYKAWAYSRSGDDLVFYVKPNYQVIVNPNATEPETIILEPEDPTWLALNLTPVDTSDSGFNKLYEEFNEGSPFDYLINGGLLYNISGSLVYSFNQTQSQFIATSATNLDYTYTLTDLIRTKFYNARIQHVDVLTPKFKELLRQYGREHDPLDKQIWTLKDPQQNVYFLSGVEMECVITALKQLK